MIFGFVNKFVNIAENNNLEKFCMCYAARFC
jgi:hypothetical protein